MIWLKTAAYAAVCLSLLIAGWQVNSWREGAKRAAALQATIDDVRKEHASAQRYADQLFRDLTDERADRQKRIDKAVAAFTRRVPIDPRCDYPDDIAGVLNNARGMPLTSE